MTYDSAANNRAAVANLALNEIGARRQTSGLDSKSRILQAPEFDEIRQALVAAEARNGRTFNALVDVATAKIKDLTKINKAGVAYLESQHAYADLTIEAEDQAEALEAEIVASAEARIEVGQEKALALAHEVRDALDEIARDKSVVAAFNDGNRSRRAAPAGDNMRYRPGERRIDKMIKDLEGPERYIVVDVANMALLRKGEQALDVEGNVVEKLTSNVRVRHNLPLAGRGV